MFYPVMKTANLQSYSDEDRQSLLKGHAIVSDTVSADGSTSRGYHQIDKHTNQILCAPASVINRNLQLIAETLNLTSSELVCMQKGLPITMVDEEDELMTIGVDLTQRNGIRYVLGDEKRL